MQYQTRSMIAANPMRYDRVELKPGDPFEATPTDARYLTRHGKASYAAAGPAPAPAVVTAVPPEAPVSGDTFNAASEPLAMVASDIMGRQAEDAAQPPAAPTRRPYTRRTPAKVEGA